LWWVQKIEDAGFKRRGMVRSVPDAEKGLWREKKVKTCSLKKRG